MVEASDEIRRHIEERLGRIAQDINELETRVKETVDWRRHFRDNTAVAMGAAFLAGMGLAWLTTDSRVELPVE